MNLPENEFDENAIDPLEGNITGNSAESLESGLFAGDTGELPLDARRVLIQLLSGPFVDVKRHSILWPVLLRDEKIIRSRLAELFLELVVDNNMQVAFTRQAETGGLNVPMLLRRARLTFIDSVLLLYLRLQLTGAESRGERSVVSYNDIMEYMSVYEKSLNTDRAGFNRRIDASIVKCKDWNILLKIRAENDRYEISPTLKLLFSAENIRELTGLYEGMAGSKMDEEPADEGETRQ